MMANAYRRCPGCGDLGDLDHIVACAGAWRDRQAFESWHAGSAAMLEMVDRQLRRRGGLDVVALQKGRERRALRHVASMRRRYGR